mgnify:CR=1 FL=1|jgi:peptidoglycan hydrolase CwlO-like protein
MKKFFSFIILILVLLVVPGRIIARDCDGNPPTNMEELNDYINSCQAKINESQAEQQTLSSAINYLNSQINLASAEITKTSAELSILETEIAELAGKIESIDYSLDDLTELFVNRVKSSYKESKSTNIALSLFNSSGFFDFFRHYQYIQKIRDHDQEVLISLESARLDFDQQKSLKETKQLEVETLQLQLESQQASLNAQKSTKNHLLVQTKNNEQQYQTLLSQALAEKSAIEQALISGVEVGPVNRGDPIALVGNSGYPGCSTGKHLHFEVRAGSSWVNPGSYLESRSVYDEDAGHDVNVGSGSWAWPVESPVRLTQHYGTTPYSWVYKYSGGIHTGLDMVPENSDVIRAPESGTLYKSSQGCGGSIINIVYIDHGNDLISLYLHVQ